MVIYRYTFKTGVFSTFSLKLKKRWPAGNLSLWRIFWVFGEKIVVKISQKRLLSEFSFGFLYIFSLFFSSNQANIFSIEFFENVEKKCLGPYRQSKLEIKTKIQNFSYIWKNTSWIKCIQSKHDFQPCLSEVLLFAFFFFSFLLR